MQTIAPFLEVNFHSSFLGSGWRSLGMQDMKLRITRIFQTIHAKEARPVSSVQQTLHLGVETGRDRSLGLLWRKPDRLPDAHLDPA